MKHLRILLIISALILLTTSKLYALSSRSLVLVTSTSSPVNTLTIQEVRKLFLGVPVEKNGESPVPLLNNCEPLIYEVFLQKVAFMSASAYESQTLSVVFRLGGKRPEIYSDLNALVNALQQHPGAVSFLWEDQVQANQGIKSVSVLWQGSLE